MFFITRWNLSILFRMEMSEWEDYMDIFKDISSATASRDLKKGAELNVFEKIGEKNKTIYCLK